MCISKFIGFLALTPYSISDNPLCVFLTEFNVLLAIYSIVVAWQCLQSCCFLSCRCCITWEFRVQLDSIMKYVVFTVFL